MFVKLAALISSKKRILIIGLVLIVGLFVAIKIFSRGTDGYVFGTVQKRTITEIVTESGIITTNGKVNVYSPTNGVIEKVFVTNGEVVSKGQKLFTVQSTATTQEVATAFAAYQTANSAVQQAENTRRDTTAIVNRIHDDLKNKGNTETFLEKETRTTAEVTNDNAWDALVAARAELVSKETAYRATQNATVTAPIAGTVSNLSVLGGNYVAVNTTLAPTSAVLVIGDLGPMEIMVSVSESEINKIKVGQEVSAKLDAVDGKVYKGLVTRFDENGTITQGVVKFNMYIEITDPDENLKPGMTADVDITTNTLADVLSVPNTAVKPYQKGRAVRKLGEGNKIEYIPVKIGVRGKEFTQITEGLVEGQQIIESLTNEKTGKTGFFGF